METQKTEIMSLMMRMRLMIKREYGVTPSLRDHDAAVRYYQLGVQSTQPALLQLANQLGAYIPSPSTDAAPASSASAESTSPPVMSTRVEPQDAAATPDVVAPALRQHPERFVELLASNLLNQTSKITHPNIGSIIIDKPHNQYYANCSLKDIASIEVLSKEKVDIKPIDVGEIQQLYPKKPASPLTELFWHCGLNMSHGELLSHLKPYPLFRFHRWPKDFSMHWEQARLANFLSLPRTIDAMVEHMGVSKADVIGFLNASFLCGLIERVASAAPPQAPSQTPPQTPSQTPPQAPSQAPSPGAAPDAAPDAAD